MKRTAPYLATLILLFFSFVHEVYADAALDFGKNRLFFKELSMPPITQYTDVKDDVEISIFPNPVVDNAVIKINTAGKRVSSLVISDAIGNRITTLNISSKDLTIVRYHNFSDLRPGIYFCSVYSDSDIMNTTKIIKQ